MVPIPDPLHPAVVHLPLALAVLIPLFALSSVLAIRLTGEPRRMWAGVVALQLLLVGSAWAALETGEHEEERVETVVAERFIEAHEEAAEQFQLAAVVALVIVAAGWVPGRAGAVARSVAVLATLGVLVLGIRTGHSGGDLVYRHGAASAYGARSLAETPVAVDRPAEGRAPGDG